jgi:ubiquinone/menaquinone biosynthesis C-methylase UbiE
MIQNASARQFYAETYDVTMVDWPGEIDFYRQLVAEEVEPGQGVVLDIACGTGRIGLRLAEAGTSVVGLDRSPDMLAVARRKSLHADRIRWVEGDMRSFELGRLFDLVLIPSHSFQHLNTAADQAACLACIRRHLKPGGLLVVHLDHMNAENMKWLGEISAEKRGAFEDEKPFRHPGTGAAIATSTAWAYEPATQTATTRTVWEEIGDDGAPVRRWETGPVPLHCVFRFEMEHLLRRAGFEVEQVYGDFYRHDLQDDSPHSLWLARKPPQHP